MKGLETMSDGIFSGLRVIDCASWIAGPAAATILSDFGAEVIKNRELADKPPMGMVLNPTVVLAVIT